MLWFSLLTIIMAQLCLVEEFRRRLMILQQNSYRNERYRRWLDTSQDSTSVRRLVSGAVLLASLSTLSVPVVSLCLIFAVSFLNWVELKTAIYKKPLVMTKRASRIFAVMALLELVVVGVVASFTAKGGAWREAVAVSILFCYCFSHCLVLAANWLLKPVENHINKGFYDDAVRILRSMPRLKIIGVTGSYGKTSTKHYLHRILSEHFDVAMTPGSFNTTLGVIRTIRENLKPYNEIFIVEMGAKQNGDIKEICDLVHPRIGIVTAVGPQHLESFKTIENVQKTKFELVDALPEDGLAVVNNDFPYIASRKVDNTECIRYAVTETDKAQYTATDLRYSPSGTDFTVKGPDGLSETYHTRLVGECNVSNLLAAITVAHRLGVPAEKIRYAVGQIEQVEHRLNMKRTPGGITIIDDAYNSNPTGSGMALDVLSMMGPGKRIVVTPGMIELGERQEELNREFGKKIATRADIAVIVGEYNREAIVSGIESVETRSAEIRTVDSFADSQKLLATLLKDGDTVLYENDLPDTFK